MAHPVRKKYVPALLRTLLQCHLRLPRQPADYNASDAVYQQNVQWLRSIPDYRVTPQTTIKNTFYLYTALRDFRNVEEYSYSADNNAIVRSAALLQRHDQQLASNWRSACDS